MSLAVLDQGGEDVDAAIPVTLKDEIQDFITGVFHHALTREIGIGVSGAGIEQSQVVIDLGGRAHRTARVAVHGLLPY